MRERRVIAKCLIPTFSTISPSSLAGIPKHQTGIKTAARNSGFRISRINGCFRLRVKKSIFLYVRGKQCMSGCGWSGTNMKRPGCQILFVFSGEERKDVGGGWGKSAFGIKQTGVLMGGWRTGTLGRNGRERLKCFASRKRDEMK